MTSIDYCSLTLKVWQLLCLKASVLSVKMSTSKLFQTSKSPKVFWHKEINFSNWCYSRLRFTQRWKIFNKLWKLLKRYKNSFLKLVQSVAFSKLTYTNKLEKLKKRWCFITSFWVIIAVLECFVKLWPNQPSAVCEKETFMKPLPTSKGHSLWMSKAEQLINCLNWPKELLFWWKRNMLRQSSWWDLATLNSVMNLNAIWIF